jgi:CRISPR-associated protein Csx10
VTLETSFKQIAPLGGFNRKWGLPLVQVPAVRAGSVFVFTAITDIAASDLRDLAERGVGQRRAEGFGRLVANWPGQASYELRTYRAGKPDASPVALSEDSEALATQMAERLLRRDLDRLLAERIMSAGCQIVDPPSGAQLSRLRAVVLNALPSGDVKRVSESLAAYKPRAREQYRRARIDGQRLEDWLLERMAAPETVWNKLSESEIEPPRIGSTPVRLGPVLAGEYTLRLVDGVLHRAAKEQADD